MGGVYIIKEYDLMKGMLKDQLVAYRPDLAKAFGGVACALFFQQIAYQSEELPDSGEDCSAWVYKTRKRMEWETALTRWEQETARRKLRNHGVLEEELRGVPAKKYYRICWEPVFRLLHSSVCGNPTNKDAGSHPASLLDSIQQDGGVPSNKEAGSPPTKRGSKEELHTSLKRGGTGEDEAGEDPEAEAAPTTTPIPADSLAPEERRSLILEATGRLSQTRGLEGIFERGDYEALAVMIPDRWPQISELKITASEVEEAHKADT